MSAVRAILPVLLIVAAAALRAASPADVAPSRADADQLLRKFAVIETNGLSTRPAPRRTAVTEQELNSFLAFHARDEIPAGVIDPAVTIDDAGRLSAHAIVDLDAVRQGQQGGGFGIGSLLRGRVPVTASGVLSTREGVGQFQLESATVGGVPVPKGVLQEVVSYYSRTPETPEGFNIDAPFQLPARIRTIETSKGQAVLVQ
jgi:hypothetical protein